MSFLSHFLNPSIFIAVLGTIQIHKLLFNMTRNGDMNSEYQEHVKEKDPYISSQVIYAGTRSTAFTVLIPI